MCEASKEECEETPNYQQFYTLPRLMPDSQRNCNSSTSKSATIGRIDTAQTGLKKEFSSFSRRASFRNIGNFLGRVVRTVATLPRDRHSRKHPTFCFYDGEQCDYVQYGADEIPGVIGLANHGNTCFINAVLQCLSNTDLLAEYLVSGQYRVDLCRKTRSNARRFGTRGELTEQLALTMRALWSRRYSADVSAQFKAYVGKYAKQFRGNEQHDAQEFLLWLLDKVHEDLNTASKRKYKPIKNSCDRPDEVVAAESLANHQRLNASFVQDIFQAQFRSSLRCPSCSKESNTFDPFLCISVPIVQQKNRPFLINIVYFNQQPRQVRMGFSVDVDSCVDRLRSVIADNTGLSPDTCFLCQISNDGSIQTLEDTDALCSLNDTDSMYCLELPPEVSHIDETPLTLVWVNTSVFDSSSSSSSPSSNQAAAESSKASSTLQRFGSPYLMQVCRDVLFEDLQKLMLKEMSATVKPPVLSENQQVPLFSVRLWNGSQVDHTVSHPLLTDTVQKSVTLYGGKSSTSTSSSSSSSGSFRLLFLLVEWPREAIEKVLTTTDDQVEFHRTVNEVSVDSPITLQQCLQLYTKTERLGVDDGWRCPSCLSNQQAEKRLSLWTLPDVLVIHLKRFRQTSSQRRASKLNARVEFPLRDLDMQLHLEPRSPQSLPTGALSPPDGASTRWSPWQRSLCHRQPQAVSVSSPQSDAGHTERDSLYQLYAVCNHHGKDLLSGHYTALCRNATTGSWFRFDDIRVSCLAESEIVTADAYMLFYQRKPLSASPQHEGGRHWAYWIRESLFPGGASGSEAPVSGGVSARGPAAATPTTADTAAATAVAGVPDSYTALPVSHACSETSSNGSSLAPLAIQEQSEGTADTARANSLPPLTVSVGEENGEVTPPFVSQTPSPDDEAHSTPVKPQVIVIGACDNDNDIRCHCHCHCHCHGQCQPNTLNYGDSVCIFVGARASCSQAPPCCDCR